MNNTVPYQYGPNHFSGAGGGYYYGPGPRQFSDFGASSGYMQASNSFGMQHIPNHYGPNQLSNVPTPDGKVQKIVPVTFQKRSTNQKDCIIRKRSEPHSRRNSNESSLLGDVNKCSTEETRATLAHKHDSTHTDTTLTPIEEVLANVDPKRRSCDNSRMIVQTSDRGSQEKRYMCCFCKKKYSKIARHLEYVHKSEPAVQKLHGLPKGSKDRRQILDNLRNKGMFEFHTVTEFNDNQLIPCRRPNAKFLKTHADYKICPKCLGMCSKKGEHIRKCCKSAFNGERLGSVMSAAVESRFHQRASDRLQMVCRRMRDTVNVRTLKFDWLIIAFGNKMCTKYPLEKNEQFIRQMLRMCGRLFHELKSIVNEITDFASLFNPRHYEDVLQAVRVIGQFDLTTNEFGTPSSALDALLQVKHVGSVLICEYIKQENHSLQKRTENFLKLLDNDASASIYKSIYYSLENKKRLKVDHLPTTVDIKAMSNYLDAEITKYSTSLAQDFSAHEWVTLGELISAWIIVFNRKRTGETQRILVTEFNSREYVTKETIDGLSAEDKVAAERYARLRICGKKTRPVSVLLTPKIIQSIDILLKHREAANISPKNKYLFALPSIDNKKIISTCYVMRKYSAVCGAQEPTTIRGTMLRKHVATLCVSKRYDDTGVGYVADFMGHHDQVHRKDYRRIPLVDEVVNVSKLLECATGDASNNGNESNAKNKQKRKSIEAAVRNGRKRKGNEVGAVLQKKRRTK